MKQTLKYIAVTLFGMALWSCNQEEMKSESVLYLPEARNSDFDKYLRREFLLPYNLELKYWLDDNEADQSVQLVPARIESSKIMAVLLKHLWLDVYAEASPEGSTFLKRHAIRLIQLVGSGGWNPNNTVKLGYAMGGKKIVLFNVNLLSESRPENLDPARLLDSESGGDFHTIHHEFAHILHQTKNFSTEYEQISVGDYLSTGWSESSNTQQKSIDLGFVTRYARMSKDEDFVEVYSCYVTMTPEAWEDLLNTATVDDNGRRVGKELVLRKLEIVRNYIQEAWGMDIDKIRDIILRRAGEIQDLEFEDLK
ncbi:MAG: putative zinc-binding metallopeptidase [Alistipes sp.]|jgi:substrate import-associated zinc metallohydrolase lipoprotein|nr:putative zinc-binding metallopeptidase [Alistipes sp.]